jgi:hypothetical protein
MTARSFALCLLLGCIGPVADPTTPEPTGPFVVRADPDTMFMKAGGTISSRGGELGTLDTAIGACQSGEHHGYFGVDVFPRGARYSSLRIAVDPLKGTTGVAIPIPDSDRTRVFERADCSKFDVAVERDESLRVGHIAIMTGHAVMDCGTVHVQLAFVACS